MAETGMITADTPPVLAAEHCGTCKNGLTPLADGHNERMIASGWLHCDCMPGWDYRSALWPCDFDPSRWAKKPAARG
jgi:hypothetical protein